MKVAAPPAVNSAGWGPFAIAAPDPTGADGGHDSRRHVSSLAGATPMPRAYGFVETRGFTGDVEATDAMNKAASVEFARRVDISGGLVTTIVTGDVGAVKASVDAGVTSARRVGEVVASNVVANLHDQVVARIVGEEAVKTLDPSMNALGMIETIGYTAMVEAADAAVKAANTEIVARLWIGSGYAIVLMRGDVAAVKASVDAGTAAGARLGKIVASHVIPSPHWMLDGPLPVGPIGHTKEQEKEKEVGGDALGFIETKGFAALVAATDAAVKAARVVPLGNQRVGNALVTMVIKGDIAAVKASVDAGATAARQVGDLVGVHVIPRPHGASTRFCFPGGAPGEKKA
jgi:carbon dioxide concentrating mechanism protein CcmO